MPWMNFGEVGPLDVSWRRGGFPKVEEVNYDAVLVLWSQDYIGLVAPWGDHLNPLRWVDSHYFPKWGTEGPGEEAWWAWVTEGGEKPRPPGVLTWKEAKKKYEESTHEPESGPADPA